MNRSRFFLTLLFFSSWTTWTQLSIDPLDYRHRIENSTAYLLDQKHVHSGVLPLITAHDGYTTGQGQLAFRSVQASRNGETYKTMRIYPLLDLAIGGEYEKNNTNNPKYIAGGGIGIDLSTEKWFITGKLLPYTTFSTYVADSIQRQFDMDLGTTRTAFGNFFTRNEFLMAYRANRFFTFLGGYGKNFFGEGYRSLLLSDNASNYPFLKIETTFGSIKYVNLYTIWNNSTENPFDKSLDRMKFSAMHYLSWNVTREFNVSIFESVVWQARDSINNRGFDISYLNPVVFYRPVEYSMGSADNVLLGVNLSYKVNKNHCIYTQAIIDEFLLSRIKDESKWWGNKWGLQLGYKSNAFLLQNLYFQAEFNVVRPFTYSHKYAVQNYGHLNASVTHPIGANFYELVNIVSYKKDKHRFTNKITYSSFGVDTDTINHGQNIFNSYADREGEYGHLIMQGLRTSVLNEQLIFETPMFEKINLYINFTYNYRMHFTPVRTTHQHYLMIGIRSRLWNAYSDI